MKTDHDTLRAFFAIDLPKPTKDWIAHQLMVELKKTLPRDHIRWIQPQNLHITLQFIPTLKPIDLQPCIDLIQRATLPKPFLVTPGAPELFPSASHPRYLSLSVEPQELLTVLSQQLGSALKTLHYPVETRPFRGHLTLGKFIGNPDTPINIEAIKPVTIEPFKVTHVTLFQSHSSKTGSLYRKLATIPLD